jgi:hypothetical protein
MENEFKPQPKPIKVEKTKMTSFEFQQKYGNNPKKAKKLIFGSKDISKISKSKLKADLDIIYSMVVRMEHVNNEGYGLCCTCNKPFHFLKAQNCHYISRSIAPSLIFNRKNTAFGCSKCNVLMHGNMLKYHEFMLKKYGKLEVNMLNILSNTKITLSIGDYELMLKEYCKAFEIQCCRLNYEPTQRQLTILNRWL